MRADTGALLALCEKTDSDIRSCINTLQVWGHCWGSGDTARAWGHCQEHGDGLGDTAGSLGTWA